MQIRHHAARWAAGLTALLAVGGTAQADHRPVIAVPGNWQVPVVIDGIPATGAVVTGDWGLYAPGRVAPEILGPAFVPPNGARAYYPHGGGRPRYGRHEVSVPRRELPPAPTFYREWSSQSGGGTVTEYPPFDVPSGYGSMDDASRPYRRFVRPKDGRGNHRGSLPHRVLPRRGSDL